MFSWYKYLIVSLFSHLGFWSGNLYLIAPFPDLCLLVPFYVLDELLYADDMDKNASSEAKIQRAMDHVSQSCNNYDLTISTPKTEAVHNQHLENRTMNQPSL